MRNGKLFSRFNSDAGSSLVFVAENYTFKLKNEKKRNEKTPTSVDEFLLKTEQLINEK